jgi:hypothetical protein
MRHWNVIVDTLRSGARNLPLSKETAISFGSSDARDVR